MTTLRPHGGPGESKEEWDEHCDEHINLIKKVVGWK